MPEVRMDPVSASPASFWEHAYRYRFATRYVREKRVLDIACGEGYGSAALSRAGSRIVLGMDISWQTCHGARQKYGGTYCAGDAHALPVPDHSIDVIVSFETVEHIRRPEVFLDECVRILTPKGLLIISTPNKAVHRESSERNPYHCSEMNEEEFLDLLASRFPHVERYTQVVKTAPWWSTRSLASTHSLWVRLKGGWRAREWIRSFLCPRTGRDLSDEDRHSPVEAILSKDRFLAAWVNPYPVRSRSRCGGEHPWYLVALCHH